VTTVTGTTKLVCPECRHENEPERIYCHSCGTRLDRSAVKVRNTEQTAEDTRQRVRRLFDPQRAKIRAYSLKLIKVILASCVLAALVQVVLPPDVPSPIKSDIAASQIRMDLENATTRRQPPQLQYTQDQVNAFLAYALKAKQSSLDKPLLVFKRVVVQFGEGTCALTVERSFFGYSVYTRSIYQPVLTGGKIEAVSKGASVGRLAIHPQASQIINLLFGDVWSALNREIKLVSKLGRMEFHDKGVVLMTRSS
jgi:hypothetical protein